MRTPGQKDLPPDSNDAGPKPDYLLPPRECDRHFADSTKIGVVNYQPLLDDLTAPSRLDERLEWVRQSYQRFFDKVLESDALLGRSALEIS